MKLLLLSLVLLSACDLSTTAQARRKQIQAAEDKFCELRAKEKAFEESQTLDSSDAGTLKH